MDAPRSMTLIALFVILGIMVSLLGAGNLMCSTAVRRCVEGDVCPNHTICVRYATDDARCSPRYCPTVLAYNRRVGTFWYVHIVNRTKRTYAAASRWVKTTWTEMNADKPGQK